MNLTTSGEKLEHRDQQGGIKSHVERAGVSYI
jgi:hypothetical protein